MTSLSQPPARRIVVDPTTCTPDDMAPAARWLRDGGIVCFPTDTFYGLAVDPTCDMAVRSLFDLKGRDAHAALPLIAASRADIERVVGVLAGTTARLAAAFWPGPLSLIVDAPTRIVPAVHGGHGTVAVRVPADRVAQSLAAAFGGLLTATSANLAGAPPAVRIAADDPVVRDARVFVVDGGTTPGGRPSTIVDARHGAVVMIRPGVIDRERIEHAARGVPARELG